jgi:hypothetical protein
VCLFVLEPVTCQSFPCLFVFLPATFNQVHRLSIYHFSAAISLNAGLFILENTTPPAYYTWGKKKKEGRENMEERGKGEKKE